MGFRVSNLGFGGRRFIRQVDQSRTWIAFFSLPFKPQEPLDNSPRTCPGELNMTRLDVKSTPPKRIGKCVKQQHKQSSP